MTENLLLVFIVVNAANVIIQTIKSLMTIKCEKTAAAFANAIAYGFYTIVLVYMTCDLPLAQKVLIVGSCNFVGVWLVKFAEEKMRKDKLWKIEVTIKSRYLDRAKTLLKKADIPFNYVDLNKYFLLNVYCESQEQSSAVKKILSECEAKYFASEGKEL